MLWSILKNAWKLKSCKSLMVVMVFDLPFVKELNTNMLVSGEMCIDIWTAICNVVEFIHL